MYKTKNEGMIGAIVDFFLIKSPYYFGFGSFGTYDLVGACFWYCMTSCCFYLLLDSLFHISEVVLAFVFKLFLVSPSYKCTCVISWIKTLFLIEVQSPLLINIPTGPPSCSKLIEAAKSADGSDWMAEVVKCQLGMAAQILCPHPSRQSLSSAYSAVMKVAGL